MEAQGLGAMVAPTQQSAGGASMQEVQQIVQMLEQGMSPQELVAKGVPAELVEAAMQMIDMQRKQTVPESQAGLGNALMAEGRV